MTRTFDGPTSARRAHLQNGVLVGSYPVPRPETEYLPRQHTAGPIVIAIIKLVDDGSFWRGDLAPVPLLPGALQDPLLAAFRQLYRYPIDSSGRLVPPQ